MKDTGSNIIDFAEAKKPTPLEERYRSLYGPEFVRDLKDAYYWMLDDMKKRPPCKVIARKRRLRYHRLGDWSKYFYVDFRHQSLYAQTIDDLNDKTIFNYGESKVLSVDNGDDVRYLLSGVYCYDRNKAKKWLHEILGPEAKILVEEA